MPTPTYDFTQDYPVRNAAGEIITAKPFPNYTAAAAPVKIASPQMPSTVVVGVPFRIVPGSYRDATAVSAPTLVNLTRRPDGLYVANAPGTVSYSETPSNDVGSMPAQTTSGTAVANLSRLEIKTPASVSPATVAVGESVTLSVGVVQGEVRREVSLVHNGVERRNEIMDGVWQPGVAGSGYFSVKSFDKDGNSTEQRITYDVASASATVPVGLRNVAHTYFDHATPYVGVATALTALLAEGVAKLNIPVTANGAEVQMTPQGLDFGTGKRLNLTGLTMDTTGGVFMIAEFTPDDLTGSAAYFDLGGQLILRRAAGNVQIAYNFGTAVNINTFAVATGTRYLTAVEIDRETGVMRYWDGSALVSVTGINASALNPAYLGIGGSLDGRVHRGVIVNKVSGQPWPITLEAALAVFNSGAVTTATIHDSDGQSLALGPNVGGLTAPNGSLWRDVNGGGNDVRMLTGLRRSDNVAVTHIVSPLLAGYDQSVRATGEAAALAPTNQPPGLITAKALKRDGVITDYCLFHFNGAGGQPVVNFDNDPSDGSANTTLYDNQAHILREAVRYLRSTGATTIRVPRRSWNQGEADQGAEPGVWGAGFDKVHQSRIDLIASVLDQAVPPKLYLIQTGGYCRKTAEHWAILDQVEAVRRWNGILVGPNWQCLVADGVVHHGIDGVLQMALTEAWAVAETEAGRAWNLLPPATPIARSGNTITIPITIRGDETLTTEPGKYANYGGDPANLGLEVEGGGSITAASVSGGNIVLTVSGTVTFVRHAFQRGEGVNYGAAPYLDSNGRAYVAHRSIIRTTLTKAETWGGMNLTLKRFLPTFRVAVV